MSQRDAMLIKACVLSLASNTNPTHYLQQAKNWLASFGRLTLSSVITNQDNHLTRDGQQEALLGLGDYFNEIAYLELDQPIAYPNWVQLTKNFEKQQDRQKFTKPQVTLDIDVIAIQLANLNQPIDDLVDEKGQQFLPLSQPASLWLGVGRRFPLACYDQKGIQELSQTVALPVMTAL